MNRTALTLFFLAAAALPAIAGSPPTASKVTPSDIREACTQLGPSGETLAGGNGCRNTTTGAAVVCADGRCTDYFADPRYAKIRALLDRHRRQQAPL